jgi:hypothetical protein
MREKAPKSSLTTVQKKALRRERSKVPVDLQAAFDAAFHAWKETWFRGGLAIRSDPRTRVVGEKFGTLIVLGPATLPLLVEKLADPENFLALQLYDALQTDEQLVVQYGPGDERILEGEQGRALRVVRAWLTNR